jgi:homoserine dehydrogenase
MSSLNAATGEPAISYLEAALRHGAHAVTANKGPVVHGYHALRDLADSMGKGFRFESTVMDGAPIFSLFRSSLPLATVSGFRGILNSTTNVILAQMEAGADLEEGIRHAQALGLAETDPSADVDGWDAAVKVAALTTVVMDHPIAIEAVAREGIRGLRGAEVRAARAAGTPYKLVCWAERHGAGVEAGVGPRRLPLSDPLARVDGTSSSVHFETDLLPGLTVVEHDPTPTTTAYGMLADFVGLAAGHTR